MREDVFFAYLQAKKFGWNEDPDKFCYEKIQGMTLDDVKAFQEKYIKGLPFDYAVLGNKQDVDMKYLRSLGKLRTLSTEEIFGY